ncbi:SDR family oxidoreductase (plasmid) [Sphingomonas paeninsulae]|jgi:NAD(P)-dependent dehydrogenase (short-subunit alcohol dehydrogenase family)|uniref:SDR family oxidoreductase n=1 Tax=Sphingomonas paeninsulae TaxID=2319844 RepID=A0A494TI20_SPHPE|nr:SDR family NAD(P)-dependent oxidoreductase [Sphingomonas paeninsulae]AYJ85476.1 SDR family oxidoreductase [Sphingomonas paeninsulae]
MQITNQTAAVVTGGASGLGEASARALADAGIKVAIFDLNAEKGEAIAKEIGGVFCNVNITDEDSVVAGFEKARAAHGQERVLVHCAQTSRGGKTVGKNRDTGGFKRFSTADYEYSILGILVASYRLASLSALGMAELEPLEDGERGVITLTASAAAQDAQVGQVGYGSAKAGVNGLALPMARDLMDLGIRVNSIMPGIFATPPMLGVPPKVLEVLSASVPFPKRLGKPSEFGSLVLELVRNSYFNGQNIRLDGAIRMPPR